MMGKMTHREAFWDLILRIGLVAVAVFGVGMLFTIEYPPVETIQRGFRGVGLVQNYHPDAVEAQLAANQVPEAIEPADPDSGPATEVYQNVQVLGDLTDAQFIRVMTAMTEWVAPEQGCSYCHAEGEELSSDSLYTKVVARRMLQMTRDINTNWQPHVAQTGVTCYTCHRGQPVPANIWFTDPGRPHTAGLLGNPAGQNGPARAAGLASLPSDPLTPFLMGGGKDAGIRINSDTALPSGNRQSIKQAEWTYSLMVNMSESLGVNCTYCHNSRSFRDWEQSSPTRASAWHGIQMVRDLNASYLEPLQPVFPPHRLGALGDVAKVNCSTCHAGVFKPLFGVGMLKDYPELAKAGGVTGVPVDPAPAAVPEPGPAQTPGSAQPPGSGQPAQ
jgi:photosynthetic reaction center cytochrome c subunit